MGERVRLTFGLETESERSRLSGEELDLLGLTYMQRLYAFGGCFAAGCFLSFLGTLFLFLGKLSAVRAASLPNAFISALLGKQTSPVSILPAVRSDILAWQYRHAHQQRLPCRLHVPGALLHLVQHPMTARFTIPSQPFSASVRRCVTCLGMRLASSSLV